VGEGRERKMGTNKCLFKQLLCLYPFPHFSQRSSGRLLLRPPSLARGCPSLARLTRAFWNAESASSPDMSLSSSSMALSCTPPMLLSVMNLRVGRLAGGEGRLATMAERERPFLDSVFRRELTAMGRGMAMSPDSWRAAATAATLAPVFVMLLRRVMRWAPLRALPRSECELFREWVCRLSVRPPGTDVDEIDGRCVSGREVCWISCPEGSERETRAWLALRPPLCMPSSAEFPVPPARASWPGARGSIRRSQGVWVCLPVSRRTLEDAIARPQSRGLLRGFCESEILSKGEIDQKKESEEPKKGGFAGRSVADRRREGLWAVHGSVLVVGKRSFVGRACVCGKRTSCSCTSKRGDRTITE